MEINRNAVKAGFTGAFAIAATLIMYFEGYTQTQRVDPVGNAEICYGHKGNIKKATHAECLLLLKEDMDHANAIIDKYVKVPISQNQRGALLDFIYNEGQSRFASSTLLRKLNKGDYAGACEELTKCEKNKETGKMEGYGCGLAGGMVLNGLVTRRNTEDSFCMEGMNAH